MNLLERRRMMYGLLGGGGGGQQPVIPYQRIEYLESSGTQYIDTGIYPTGNSCVKMQFSSFTNTFWNVGARFNFMRDAFMVANGGTSGTAYNQLFINYGTTYVLKNYPNDELKHTIEMSNSIYFDGTLLHTFNLESFTSTSSYAFFAMKYLNNAYTSYCSMRIYHAELYDNGTLLFDAYPVRVGTTGYLYDTISQQLYGNVGTGNFILGPDI